MSNGRFDAGADAIDGSAERIESLVRRLGEAEAALDAIISGQVDAVTDPLTAGPVLLRDAQEALRRSEQRYRDLVARSPAIVCELAPDGTTLFVNDAVTPLLGYEPSDLAGKNWWDTVCPPGERERAHGLFERFQRGDVSNYELLVAASDGSSKTTVWNSANRYATDGSLASVVAFGLDITERKIAEETTRRLAAEKAARAEAEAAERRAELLAEASRVFASSLDDEATLASVANLVVPALADWSAVDVLTEQGAMERLAVRHADPEKLKWAEELRRRYPPDPNARNGVAQVLRSGKSALYPDVAELLWTGARDEEHLAALRTACFRSAIIVPLTVRRRTIGALTLVTAESGRQLEESDLRTAEDLAHRAAVAVENARLYKEAGVARAEAERARAEAETANRAKSEFLARMSHELRTPLNAISGYTQLLEEEIRGPVNEQQRDYLERIRRSQQHLLGLINDVLNFAKLEAGRVQFDVTEVPLSEALAEVDDLIAPQVGAKGLGYQNRGCESEIVVRADREKMRQVILNLLSNAVKFTPTGGHIVVECRTEGSGAAIMVRDDGIGISPDKLQAIFEPFVQLGKDVSREGTGLGLAISRDLARAMGGDLTAASAPGEGSAFVFTLPLAGREAGERPRAKPTVETSMPL